MVGGAIFQTPFPRSSVGEVGANHCLSTFQLEEMRISTVVVVAGWAGLSWASSDRRTTASRSTSRFQRRSRTGLARTCSNSGHAACSTCQLRGRLCLAFGPFRVEAHTLGLVACGCIALLMTFEGGRDAGRPSLAVARECRDCFCAFCPGMHGPGAKSLTSEMHQYLDFSRKRCCNAGRMGRWTTCFACLLAFTKPVTWRLKTGCVFSHRT